MRILLYGYFAAGQLGATYGRAFTALGHEVIAFAADEEKKFLAPWLRQRLLHRLTIRSGALRAAGARRWNAALLERVRATRPEFVFILNGDFLVPATLRSIRNAGVPVLLFNADNPFRPFPSHRPESVTCIPECDVFFTWSRALQAQLTAAGARRVELLPFAWDPIVFPYAETPAAVRPAHPVVFVGGWDRERETWLETVAEHFDLRIWGSNYWSSRTRAGSRLRRCWQGRPLAGEEAGALLRGAGVSLNLLRRQNPDGTNMRTFEVPGCGGFCLATRTAGARELLPEDESGAYLGDPAEMIAQLRRFLGDPTRREAIRRTAHRVVAERHTYVQRAQVVVDCAAAAGRDRK